MKVGDYVRTKNGIIGKIEIKNFIGYSDWIIDTLYYNDDEIIDDWTCGVKEYDILKSSPNIIDLIEVGDYVNGHKVVEVDLDDLDDYGNTFRYIKTEHDYTLNHWIKENEIENILTREQFEAMQYEVK